MLASPRDRMLTVVVAIALLAVLAESTNATAPGRNGPIVFRRQLSPGRPSAHHERVSQTTFGRGALGTRSRRQPCGAPDARIRGIEQA